MAYKAAKPGLVGAPGEGNSPRKPKVGMSLGASPQNKPVLAPAKGLKTRPEGAGRMPFACDPMKDGTRAVGGKRHTVQY